MNDSNLLFTLKRLALVLLVLSVAGCAGRGQPIPPGQEGAPFATLETLAVYGIDPGYKITDDSNPLSDTKWQVLGMTPKPPKAYTSIYMNFKSNGDFEEITTFPDGSVKRENSFYKTAGATLAITKAKNVVVDGRFRIDGNRLLLDTGEYSIVLQRVQ
jgi:hypothetical protein